jgi:hypothetical protein
MYVGNVAESDIKALLGISRIIISSIIFDIQVNHPSLIKDYMKIVKPMNVFEYRDNKVFKYKHIFERQLKKINNYA